MPGDLLPIEHELRSGELLDPDAHLVLRGSPLTVEGIMANAERTAGRFTLAGQPFVAISVDVTIAGWDIEKILARRLDTRRQYATARAAELLEAGFDLLATFTSPHYSLRLPSYTSEVARQVVDVFGQVKDNPYYQRRRKS